MAGKNKSKIKGYRYEKEFEKLLRDAGLPAFRIIASGAGSENPKIDVKVGSSHFPRDWQVKERKKLPEWLFGDLDKVSALAIRQPHGPWYMVITLQDFLDWLDVGILRKEEQ